MKKEKELDEIAREEYKKLLAMWFFESKPEDDPALYNHQVLSHGFMEFCRRTGIFAYLGKLEDEKLFLVFKRFCEVNDVPEAVMREGWQEYLED